MAGIEARGVLGECDGVLSGYMGAADIGAAILDAVATVKRANPAARYCCDPVIGDVGRGIFVRDGIPEFMREKAVPAADIITPNQFELDYLSKRESGTLRAACDAVKAVHDLGPRTILITSLHTDDTPADCIDMLASDDSRPLPCAHAETAADITARATRSPRCSSRTICEAGNSPKRCRARPPVSSACWQRRRRAARAKSS